MSSVLILNHEPLTDRMPGPTIRNWELAKVLASKCTVTLAVPGRTEVRSPDFRVVGWDGVPPAALVAGHDVVKVSGYLLYQHPHIAQARHLVVDIYDPFPLENLHMYDEQPVDGQYRIASQDREVQTALIRAGDVFLCASERQRDFWMGWLAAAGRVNPYTHKEDPALERFTLLVPFGVPESPPEPAPRRFRGSMPGIATDDLIALWGGGIWNWFDPLTLIQAVARTKDRLPKLRLVFPAPTSPSPEVLPMRMADRARRLSDDLGLTGSRVFFGSSWIPYSERGGMLLEADIGLSLHAPGVETRYSFRTRILDYLWGGLPIIATAGDSMADLIRDEDLGIVVPPHDVDAVAAALIALGSDAGRRRACASRSGAAAKRFRWSVVAQPLVEYCVNPYTAPDRGRIRSEARPKSRDSRPTGLAEAGRVFTRIAEVAFREGPTKVFARGRSYLRRRFGPNAPRG